MNRYPFLIRGPTRVRHVVVEAEQYNSALSKVLSLYPSKFVKTKYALNMVLIDVKKEVVKISKANKNVAHQIWLNEVEGEFYITWKNEQGHTMLQEELAQTPLEIGTARTNRWKLQSTFLNGNEVGPSEEENKIPAQSEKAKKLISKQNPKTEPMTKSKKAPAAKKAAKKSAAKKAAVKKTGKKSGDWGKVVSISIADMRKGIKKGFTYRDPQGTYQTEKYMATRAKQDYVREGMFESKES